MIGDATEGTTEADHAILRDLPKDKVFWVWNKVDQKDPPKQKTGSAKEFSLSAEVVSQPINMDSLDQNQFGFYFTTVNGKI